MARPDKSYLEKQTARRPEKKKKVNEGSPESRYAKISFKAYLRQIEEEELYNENSYFEDEDMDDAGTFTSPDGKVTVTLDLGDPEEREMNISVTCSSEDEARELLASEEIHEWLSNLLEPHDLDPYDANEDDSAEEEYGWSFQYSFGPAE